MYSRFLYCFVLGHGGVVCSTTANVIDLYCSGFCVDSFQYRNIQS